MTSKNMKKNICIRTFSALFAIYLVLMSGFSIFLLSQEKKQKGIELQAYTYQVNNIVEEILKENMDQNNHIVNSPALKSALLNKTPTIYGYDTELAVYTDNLDLIFNTNDYWRCSFTAYIKGSTYYTQYGYLDPKKWFDKKEVEDLSTYLKAVPDAKKNGDLIGYSLSIDGLWLDNEMIIPDKIYVTPMYVMGIDKDGNTSASSGTRREDLVYSSNYVNTKGLPYYEDASIEPTNTGNPDSDKCIALRNMVLDKDRLKEAVNKLHLISYEPVNPVTYRYYLIMPYQNTVNADEGQDYTSASWTVVAREVNLLDQCAVTLAFLWASCFFAFFAVALILSRQTYKTYEKRAELEAYRKETTNALAHDLKTPLTIISGYAQNLIENVHTEKREHYATSIQSNVTRMDTIIREMLELSRIEAHNFQVLEEVPLKALCTDLITRYNLVCEENFIQVVVEGDAIIKADNALIQRVIDNFFVNALDHTPSGGIIRIQITNTLFEFYNSGSTIPEEKINEIWKPYKKVDESRSNTKGTGLGLSIASTILEQYHFSYGARNDNDGVVFWFRFG